MKRLFESFSKFNFSKFIKGESCEENNHVVPNIFVKVIYFVLLTIMNGYHTDLLLTLVYPNGIARITVFIMVIINVLFWMKVAMFVACLFISRKQK